MSHSKRNTSRAVFTSHERAMAKSAWSSSTARLSRESFLPFASCWLCLEPAIDPVACAHGDIFCRECALSNILAQKKEIKRNERARELEAQQELEDQARQDLEAQERAIREFELTQAGLSIKRTPSANNRADNGKAESSDSPGNGKEEDKNEDSKPNQKRKFSLDADEIARLAAEERAKLRKTIDQEKASKPTLPSFWSPSVTPSSNKNDTLHQVKKKIKTQPTCPASSEDNPHYYSLHTLIPVNFTEEETTNDSKTKVEKHRICPACNKGLSNTSRATLAKPCGHVLCKSCVDKFVRTSGEHDPHAEEKDLKGMRCYVCETSLVEGEKMSGKKEKKAGKEEKERIKPGLVELRREGTGFSASGTNQIKKEGTSFAC
ncbi:hypothetical protein V8F20_008472 [Naviculisporaceae sp. PSN 640]